MLSFIYASWFLFDQFVSVCWHLKFELQMHLLLPWVKASCWLLSLAMKSFLPNPRMFHIFLFLEEPSFLSNVLAHLQLSQQYVNIKITSELKILYCISCAGIWLIAVQLIMFSCLPQPWCYFFLSLHWLIWSYCMNYLYFLSYTVILPFYFWF